MFAMIGQVAVRVLAEAASTGTLVRRIGRVIIDLVFGIVVAPVVLRIGIFVVVIIFTANCLTCFE